MVYSIRGTPIKSTTHGNLCDNFQELLNTLSKNYGEINCTLFNKISEIFFAGCLCDGSTADTSYEDAKKAVVNI